MIEPLKSVTIKRTEGDRVRSTLWAMILDSGALEYERSDYGELVEEVWGRDEYEYNVTVRLGNEAAGGGRNGRRSRLQAAPTYFGAWLHG